ncbi:hypothetical protein E2562_011716 [Oryza meyeriana var. granulata]|uniref:TF-B3 domain-containing protein n=1 Tax=Oryza meyeriana var. granulata TaxID=110450 RepID=A0A6G1DGH4_9ORYZ|nr:hypothetical protein E2562_011716 [Oryza meyeriana var. granulata]
MENLACPSSKQVMQQEADPSKLKGFIKPKVEPCDDDELLPPASEDWEATTPLAAGNPFFTTVVAKSHIHPKFQMWIPTRFQHRLPEARTAAVLRCGGKSWATSYCGDLKMKKFDAGWAEFAVDNRLRVGDACVLELIVTGSSSDIVVEFQVQILRGGLPEEVITSKGGTSDEPIVIVD